MYTEVQNILYNEEIDCFLLIDSTRPGNYDVDRCNKPKQHAEPCEIDWGIEITRRHEGEVTPDGYKREGD